MPRRSRTLSLGLLLGTMDQVQLISACDCWTGGSETLHGTVVKRREGFFLSSIEYFPC